MAGMTDPMDSLILLQRALDESLVSFDPCEKHPEVAVHYDTPNNTARFTYVIFKGKVAQSIALFVMTEPVGAVSCFQMGWATIESARGQGLATNVVSKGLSELKSGMKRNGINKFFIEAIIAESNIQSIKLADRLFTEKAKACTDSFSGVSAIQFLELV